MNSTPALSYAVEPFAQHMLPDSTLLEGRLAHFFATQRYPLRMISVSARFGLDAPISAVQQQLQPLDALAEAVAALREAPAGDEATAARLPRLPLEQQALLLASLDDLPELRARLLDTAPDAATWNQVFTHWDTLLWRRRWLRDYRRLLGFLGSQRLRRIRHGLLAWPPPGTDGGAFATLAAAALGTPVTAAPFVAPLAGRMREQRDYLEPLRPGQPYAALLTSYDLRGSWDLHTLHALLRLPCELALAIDSVPLSQGAALLQTDAAFRTQRAQVRDTALKDVRAERALRDVEVAMHALDQQALHRLSVTVLVQAADRATLEAHTQEVRGLLGSRLRLMRPAGAQAALLRLFSTTPTAAIDAPLRPRTALSHGVAVSVPFGFCRPSRTDGTLWGIEQGSAAPIFFDPFAGGQAAHMVCVGKTGSGKTFALLLWLLRLLLAGHQAIIIEPMGHAARLVQACGAGGASYRLELGQPLNVLDIAVPPGQGRLAAQIAHVRGQLGVLLGSSVVDGQGESQFAPRVFSNAERAALEQALSSLYGGSNPDEATTQATPLLADLCGLLCRGTSAAARLLADEIDGVLVSSSQGHTFNRHTAIDWRFEADCCAYDVANVPAELRSFYYGQALGALSRYVHDRRRRQRPLVAAFDEFKYLSQARSLEGYAALAARTWRTRGAAIWVLDQTMHTFMGLPGHENPAGRSLIDNAPLRMIFRQDDAATRQVSQAIGLLTPAHLDAVRLAEVGECVAVLRDQVHHLSVQASDAEQRFFSGT